IMIVFSLLPLLYVLSASLNPIGSLTSSNGLFTEIGFGAYERLFNDPSQPFAAWFGNTMLIATITAILTVFMGALAAYSFSRMRFSGRRFGLMTIVLIQMFPQLL